MSTAPVSISARCIYCKAIGEPMIGDGFRKRCRDMGACAQRVTAAAPSAAASAGQKAAPATTKSEPSALRLAALPARNTNATNAEALIELLQAEADVAMDGPFRLGTEISLPLRAAQARYVTFGKTGSGKSNTSAVMIENCYDNNVPVCGFDLVGNLWGLRCFGTTSGIKIPIIGGPHGDLPLDLNDGAELARIFASGQSMLLDLSLLTREDQQWFARDFFTESLCVQRRPAHVVVEEAEAIAAAFSRGKAQFAAQGAFCLWARQVRNFGVGWTASTQRLKLLHPDVTDSSNVFLAMQMTGDAAQRAIGREAATRVGSRVIAEAILRELGRLPAGRAWLLPDPSWLGGTKSAPVQLQIRQRRTFDSTEVPQIGKDLPIADPPVKVDLTAFSSLVPADEPARKRKARI